MGPQQESLVGALGWTAALIVLLGVFWLVWFMLRKWYQRSLGADEAALPWTLEDLRDLRSRGEITADEFERLRQQMIGGFRDTE